MVVHQRLSWRECLGDWDTRDAGGDQIAVGGNRSPNGRLVPTGGSDQPVLGTPWTVRAMPTVPAPPIFPIGGAGLFFSRCTLAVRRGQARTGGRRWAQGWAASS